MTELIIILSVFVLLILLVVWRHYFRQSYKVDSANSKHRDEANVTLFHEHKAEIERDYQEKRIDKENYQYLLEELEKSLLLDMEANVQEDAVSQNKTTGMSLLWPIVITLFIFLFSGGVYLQTGAYAELDNMQVPEQQTQSALSEEEAKLRTSLVSLQEKINLAPDNDQLWYELGQTLVTAGQFKYAISAYDRVLELKGEQAYILGAKAQALYYFNQQKIDADLQVLIDRTLALDTLEPSVNILLGMHYFMQQAYPQAIGYWQKLLDAKLENINSSALQEAINEATRRLSVGPTTSTAPEKKPEPESGPELVLEVSLSAKIQQLLGKENSTVFVYATPATGQRMPLAVVKLVVSDLPTRVTLNNSQAMSLQFTLGSVDSVHLHAVVSKTGRAGIKSGDFVTHKENIAVTRKGVIRLVIDEIAP